MTSEVIVIGAGAAGIAAAQWLRNLEVPFEWVTADASLGGTLNRVGNPIDNYPGVPVGTGKELVSRFERSLDDVGLRPRCRNEVRRLRFGEGSVTVSIRRDGRDLTEEFSYALVCTGTRPRLLGLEGENELLGEGVEISVTRNIPRYRGKRAVIVGGGDAALQGALLLAPCAKSVTVIHRGSEFRGQERFVSEVVDDPRIAVQFNREVVRLVRTDGTLVGVELDDGSELRADGLFERIGVEPALIDGIPDSCLDDAGYLATNPDGQTSLSRLFAAGDVTGRAHQSVGWAVGTAGRACTKLRALVRG